MTARGLVAVLVGVFACGPTDPLPPDGGGGGGGCECTPPDSPCLAAGPPTCDGGACTYPPAPDGTICEGSADEPIHGECAEGGCIVTEWTCIHEPTGTPCIGGTCVKPGPTPTCCTGCVTAMGSCDHSAGIVGGVPCP